MEPQRFLFSILNFFGLNYVISGFMTGAPDWSCKDPSAFHTLRINASHERIIMPQDMSTNPYTLDVDATSFYPGSKVTVTIRGIKPGTTFNGFFIQAVQANMAVTDLRRQAFGTFTNTTPNERPSKCQPINGIPRGGATHNTSTPKESASVIWLAPESYNPGQIQFLATGVHDYSTYWTDIRSPVLTPEGYPSQSEPTQFYWTPTATWYRWLQYVLQQQLLLDYIAKTANQGAGPTATKAELDPKKEGIATAKVEPHFKETTQDIKPVVYTLEKTQPDSSTADSSASKVSKESTAKPLVP